MTTPLFVENNPLRNPGKGAVLPENLHLMICIQSAEREGFTHLAAALVSLLKVRLGISK